MKNLWKRHLTKITLLAISLTFVALLVINVGAYSSGITGNSQTGCTPCHGSEADSGTTVSITGLPNQFTPEETYLLTVNVTSTTVSGGNGGFDLSVTAGTLSTTDLNAQISNGEATHKNNNARSWQVNWTAPGGGAVTFYVAGVAANDAGGANGDAWNLQQYSASAAAAPGNELPRASFDYTSDGLTVEFTDQSSDPDGTVTSWSWDFGDGFSSTEKNPTHIFPTMDTYNVILTVTDNQEDSDVASKVIMVPSSGERTQIWTTQVAVVSVAIAFLSFVAVGIAHKMRGKEAK